jgi:TolA-binding protein
MKATGIISTAVLSLLLGTAALAYAQQEQDKPASRDEKAQKDKPAKQPDTNKAEEKNAQQENKNNNQQGQKSTQQNKVNDKQHAKNANQQEKNNQRQAKNSQPAQRSNGNRGRIPDDRFRANFGREHSFRVSQADYNRDRHFQYGGYSFVFVDAWPSNWLYTQDVFVVEINGVYYLCNAAYPDVNIALSIED